MSTSAKELEEQLAQARKDIETLAVMAGDRAKTMAQDTMASASDNLSALSSEARAVYDRAAAEGRHVRKQTEEQIRSNPLAATGIAFLAGAVLATLLGRK